MFRWLKDLWQKGAPKPPPTMPIDPPSQPVPEPPPREPETVEQRAQPLPRARPIAARPAKPLDDWRSYDEVAADYERVHAPYTIEPVKDLLKAAHAEAGARVLDVGTGTALAVAITEEALGGEALVAGVDPAARMLEIAHEERPGLKLAASEVLDLPFRSEAFDIVVANFALPYFRKLDTALYEIKRVLRPGGALAATIWSAHEDDLTRTWRLLCEEAVGRDVLKAGLKDEIPWAQKLGDPKRLEAALRDDGFRPVRVHKHKYRFEIPREDYILGHEIEAMGRYVKRMLGPMLWDRFRERVRASYTERFPETLLDFRDVLIAVATKP